MPAPSKNRTVIISTGNTTQVTSAPLRKKPFSGSDLSSRVLTLTEDYKTNSVEIIVRGAYWIPKNDDTTTSDTWEFKELGNKQIEIRENYENQLLQGAPGLVIYKPVSSL